MRVEPLPEPVARVADFLRAAGAEARLEEFAGGTPTAREAAEAVGCDLSRIVKSLVFLCDSRPVLVLVPGNRRADAAKIAGVVGAGRVRVARPEEVLDITGFEPGAVAPFPLRRVDRVLVDRTLVFDDLVWIGAGSTRHMAGLPAGELLRLTRAEPVDVADEG